MKCPTCKKIDTYRSWEGKTPIMGVEVSARGRKCTECGEVLLDLEATERAEREVAAELVARGIRTANEFKLVRKVAGFQAREVAELLDVRPETVSRWERGEIEIPRTAAFALGQLFEHPKLTRQKLEAFAR